MHPLIAAEQTTVPEQLRPFVPTEGLIDRALKKLVAKLVQNGHFSPKEQRDYDELTMERVRRMTPPRLHSRQR